jgi:hypothetical protein
MRGDSLRDFYAKSLAVMGLGLLAGLGALMDYWPVDVGTPRFVTGPALIESLAALDAVRVPSADRFATLSTSSTPRVVRASAPVLAGATYRGLLNGGRPVVTFARHVATPAATALHVNNNATLFASTSSVSVSLGLPPDPAVTDAAFEVMSGEDTYAPRVAPSLAGTDDGYVSMISGAFKKTGESIVKGGAKTGASIMDGFHAITGAFKKVPWF